MKGLHQGISRQDLEESIEILKQTIETQAQMLEKSQQENAELKSKINGLTRNGLFATSTQKPHEDTELDLKSGTTPQGN